MSSSFYAFIKFKFVSMLFDGREFEHKFRESVLRKGLSFYNKGKVELLVHPTNFSYKFLVSTKEVELKKRGDKILSYSCTCALPFCGHLAAVLFYFYKELVPAIKKGSNTGKITFRQSTSEDDSFTRHQLWVKQILRPFIHLERLDQKAMNVLLSKLQQLLLAVPGTLALESRLALYVEFHSVVNLRLQGDENALLNFFKKTENELDVLFKKGLSIKDREKWFQAVTESLRSNKSLSTKAYFFLVPRYVAGSSSKHNLQIIHQLLSARKETLNNKGFLSHLLIAKLEVLIRESVLLKLPIAMSLKNNAEFVIAQAELNFCKQKDEKAFKILIDNCGKVKSEFRLQYPDYLEYARRQACLKHQVSYEVLFLKHSMISGLFIKEKELQRLEQLVNKKVYAEVLNELIDVIRGDRKINSFDKLSLLLFKAGRYAELVKELKKQSHKFRLVNDVAHSMLPEFSPELHQVYAKHLTETLTQSKYHKVHMELLELTGNYLSNLPSKAAEALLSMIFDKVGHQSQVAMHLHSLLHETSR